MRTYSLDVATASIAYLYTITRLDGEVIRLTSWPTPITVTSGDVFSPAVGIKGYDISERNDGTPASTQLELSAYDGAAITAQDVADGLYDAATLRIDIVDADNPTFQDFHFYGRIGPTSKPIHGTVTFEARNPYAFPRSNLVPVFTVMCRFPFGGTFCGIPVMRPDVARSTAYAVGDTVRKLTGITPAGYGNAYFEVTSITTGITAATAPSYDYTVGNTTTDGGVTFTARNAWERACEIDSVVNRHNLILTTDPDPRDVDGWYAPGKIMFVSGRNNGHVFRIGAWTQSTLQLTTYLPAGLLAQAGDLAFIWPDCDKTLASGCHDKFNNARRFGGFPYYEGAKAVSSSNLNV